ncbi:MAG: hypothetical protein ABL973_01100 [Micropepsaceae bacterium]
MVDTLRLDPALPLIICDADEVLLQFMAGLERYLHRKGLYIELASFRIHGNVRDQNSHAQIADEAVSGLIAGFFASDTASLEPVAGAADALENLSRHAQILVLSNLPASARQARIDNLVGHRMPYPVIAGAGPKGAIVQKIVAGICAPVVFIDDLPPHHTSVAAATPHVHRLHFVADKRLAKLIDASPDAHARIDTWPEAEHWIRSALSTG